MKRIFIAFSVVAISVVTGMLSINSMAKAEEQISNVPKNVSAAMSGENNVITDDSMVKNAPLPTDYTMGSKDAPVVMIEYASLSCPHCAHFYAQIMPELKKNYIETGKMLYILRQYPLNLPALKGAILVGCVGEKQGSEKYYLFNKVLFDSQSKWAFDGGSWFPGLEKIAALGGINKEEFANCVNDKKREEAVIIEKKKAMDELAVPHTPYLFIAGKPYTGDLTISAISSVIDSALKKK
ncbi:MAG: thioredoxin domain-containing protein [Rickettsiales bacterium]